MDMIPKWHEDECRQVRPVYSYAPSGRPSALAPLGASGVWLYYCFVNLRWIVRGMAVIVPGLAVDSYRKYLGYKTWMNIKDGSVSR